MFLVSHFYGAKRRLRHASIIYGQKSNSGTPPKVLPCRGIKFVALFIGNLSGQIKFFLRIRKQCAYHQKIYDNGNAWPNPPSGSPSTLRRQKAAHMHTQAQSIFCAPPPKNLGLRGAYVKSFPYDFKKHPLHGRCDNVGRHSLRAIFVR